MNNSPAPRVPAWGMKPIWQGDIAMRRIVILAIAAFLAVSNALAEEGVWIRYPGDYALSLRSFPLTAGGLFLANWFFSFLFSTKFWENFWNNTIHVIAQKLSINQISYHRLNGLKIRIVMNAYIMDLRMEISLPRNSAIKVKLHITAALKTLASLPHINA